ncbi:hypothetical protein ElyMa_006417500 [Elysia marginata]|uniref:Uncharacterized protein n=1 Tax=Elysia marginata TaxID=1093978 RepID=A0AAV4HUY0_9GAST|nr:hypothetical protein ElyMa_006417500 [Elysia marginata]
MRLALPFRRRPDVVVFPVKWKKSRRCYAVVRKKVLLFSGKPRHVVLSSQAWSWLMLQATGRLETHLPHYLLRKPRFMNVAATSPNRSFMAKVFTQPLGAT